jgi:hypothetical protein
MPKSAQTKMQHLMDKNTLGTIDTEELAELTQLVERGNRLMLRKAEASAVLIARGYIFTQADFKRRRHG